MKAVKVVRTVNANFIDNLVINCWENNSEEMDPNVCPGLEALKKLCEYVNRIVALQEKLPQEVQQMLVGTAVPLQMSDLESDAEPESEVERYYVCSQASRPTPQTQPQPVNPYWMKVKSPDHPMLPVPRPPKTVEIRGGDLIGQCHCVKRNGLQEDCPKTECQGHALCLTWPMPRCQPSGLGQPIIIESRIKKPDPVNCEAVTEDPVAVQKAKEAEKRRADDQKFIQMGRANYMPPYITPTGFCNDNKNRRVSLPSQNQTGTRSGGPKKVYPKTTYPKQTNPNQNSIGDGSQSPFPKNMKYLKQNRQESTSTNQETGSNPIKASKVSGNLHLCESSGLICACPTEMSYTQDSVRTARRNSAPPKIRGRNSNRQTSTTGVPSYKDLSEFVK